MKILLDDLKVICENKTGINNYFAWPTVARLHDGRLAMTASGFRLEHVDPFGKSVICYSDDEGKTWTRPAIVIDTPLDDRDTGICVFGENEVMVTTFNNTVEFQLGEIEIAQSMAENKRGYAKNPRIEMLADYKRGYLKSFDAKPAEEKYLGSPFVISHDDGKTFDDVKRIPVSSPHGPCAMPDGTALYVGCRFFASCEIKDEPHLASYKVYPNGEYEFLTYIENSLENALFCEPHAVRLKNGKIIVHIRVQNIETELYTTFQCESYDDGKTFTKPHQILGDKAGSPCHLIELSDGTILSVYLYNGEDPFMQHTPSGIQYNEIRAMFSFDGGETWDADHVLYSNELKGLDMGYPASVELEDKSILTVFYGMPEENGPAVIMQRNWRFEK